MKDIAERTTRVALGGGQDARPYGGRVLAYRRDHFSKCVAVKVPPGFSDVGWTTSVRAINRLLIRFKKELVTT